MAKRNKFKEKKARAIERLVFLKTEREKMTVEASQILAALSDLRLAEMSLVASSMRKAYMDLERKFHNLRKAAKDCKNKSSARALRREYKILQVRLKLEEPSVKDMEKRTREAKEYISFYAKWLDEPIDDFFSLEYRALYLKLRTLIRNRKRVVSDIQEIQARIQRENRFERRIQEKSDENRVYQMNPGLEAFLAQYDLDRSSCTVREKPGQIDIYYNNFGENFGFKHGHIVYNTNLGEVVYYRKYGSQRGPQNRVHFESFATR